MNLVSESSQTAAAQHKIKKEVGPDAFFIFSASHTKTKTLLPFASRVDVAAFLCGGQKSLLCQIPAVWPGAGAGKTLHQLVIHIISLPGPFPRKIALVPTQTFIDHHGAHPGLGAGDPVLPGAC